MKNVLWTGGWDSTFRILDLVLVKGEVVQPYYVLDMDRKSTQIELQTMSDIKKMVGELKPGAENLIKEHIFIKLIDIPSDEEISLKFKKLYEDSFLGSQYDWLGRYVKSIGLEDLELCIHKDDKAEYFVRDNVRHVIEDNDDYYKLIDNPKNNNLSIFSRYHFPLLMMTKLDMLEASKKNNFQHIMEHTWFCHKPTKDNKPCGLCNPCKYTREEGLGRRVPKPPLIKALKLKLIGFLRQVKKMITK